MRLKHCLSIVQDAAVLLIAAALGCHGDRNAVRVNRMLPLSGHAVKTAAQPHCILAVRYLPSPGISALLVRAYAELCYSIMCAGGSTGSDGVVGCPAECSLTGEPGHGAHSCHSTVMTWHDHLLHCTPQKPAPWIESHSRCTPNEIALSWCSAIKLRIG